jgi:ankyrin repeat protein
VLHKIIFGHLKRSLETELQNEEHLACINKTDSLGRTALSWAAQRADLASVQTLLRNGADPNICSTKNHAPLHYAAEAQSPSCILPLLLHGAEVGKVDREGQSALHYATMHTSDLEYYRPLVEAGIPVDGKTIWGLTPMMQLSELNRVEATRYLLDNGADINLKGQDGKTPIFLAVEYNSHETLQLLWERGADFAVKVHADHGGMTIVHFAARFADVETLKILTGFKIAVDDLDVLTPEGLTIPQVVEERLRAGNITGFGEAFTCLCQSLRQPDVEIENNTDSLAPGARESIEDTEDDQFFDSFEYIT